MYEFIQTKQMTTNMFGEKRNLFLLLLALLSTLRLQFSLNCNILSGNHVPNPNISAQSKFKSYLKIQHLHMFGNPHNSGSTGIYDFQKLEWYVWVISITSVVFISFEVQISS